MQVLIVAETLYEHVCLFIGTENLSVNFNLLHHTHRYFAISPIYPTEFILHMQLDCKIHIAYSQMSITLHLKDIGLCALIKLYQKDTSLAISNINEYNVEWFLLCSNEHLFRTNHPLICVCNGYMFFHELWNWQISYAACFFHIMFFCQCKVARHT